jgi:hypothetical protein
MDISKWTDAQLIQHGWTPAQIQYQRSLEAQTPQHLKVEESAVPNMIEINDYNPDTSVWTAQTKQKPKSSRKKLIAFLSFLTLSIIGYVAYFGGWI